MRRLIAIFALVLIGNLSIQAQSIDGAGQYFAPIWSPTDDALILVSKQVDDTTSEIWLVNIEEQTMMKVSPAGEGLYAAATWSADGTTITFFLGSMTGRREIWRVAHDGTNLTNLTEAWGISGRSPEWSPDMNYLAYLVDGERPSSTLMIYDVRNGIEIQLTESSDTFISSFDWSPNSTQLVFSYTKPLDMLDSGLGVVDVDSVISTEIHSGLVTLPIWSAALDRIFFGWDILSEDVVFPDIMVIDPDGSNLTNLTNTRDNFEVFPVVSPNGEYLAYHIVHPDPPYRGLIVMKPDGSDKVNLSAMTGCIVNYYSWSPDSERLALGCTDVGMADIWIVNRDGSNAINLTGE